MAVCVVFQSLALLCVAADNWPYGSASFGVEEENSGNAVRCSALAYRATKFMRMDACVGVCIATAECRGLFFDTCI